MIDPLDPQLTAHMTDTADNTVQIQVADGAGYVLATYTTTRAAGFVGRLDELMAADNYHRRTSYTAGDGDLQATVRRYAAAPAVPAASQPGPVLVAVPS